MRIVWIVLLLSLGARTWAQTELRFEPAPDWFLPFAEELDSDPLATDDDPVQLVWDEQVNALDLARQEWSLRRVWSVHGPSGVQDGSQVKIEFDPSYQELSVHELAIWRNGERIDCNGADAWRVIQREAGLENGLLDGSVTAFSFLGGARQGDRIVLHYTIHGNNPSLGESFLDSFSLTGTWGLGYVGYRALVPFGAEIFTDHGAGAPRVRAIEGGNELFWSRRASEPIDVDSGTPYWTRIGAVGELSSFANWGEVADWGTPLYQFELEPADELTSEIARIATLEDTEARALEALTLVRDQVRYLGLEYGIGSYVPRAPGLVFDRRFGDCKDKVTLLLSILRAVDVDAFPALVHSNRGARLSDSAPTPYSFNHVVLCVRSDDGLIWLDPTSSWSRGDFRHRAKLDFEWALPLEPGSKGLVPIAEGIETSREIHVRITPDGTTDSAGICVTTTAHGSAADDLRAELAIDGKDEYLEMAANFYADYYGNLESTAPLEVHDDEALNQIRTVEHYDVHDFWIDPEDGSGEQAWISPLELASLIPDVPLGKRTYDLFVGTPQRLVYEIECEIAGQGGLELDPTRIENDAFLYVGTLVANRDRVIARHDFELLRATIPAESVARVAEDAKAVHEDLESWIARDTGAMNWPAGGTGIAVRCLVLAIVIALGVALYRSSRR